MLRRFQWLLLLVLPWLAGAQTSSGMMSAGTSARNDLLKLFQAESKRGTYLFYTQAYTLHGSHIGFQGSVFGVIQNAQADGCDLKIESEIFDHYSGNIGSKSVGLRQNKYITTIDFKLTPELAEDLRIIDGRPIRQLGKGTNAVCSGGGQCTLTWLRLNAKSKAIKLIDITDDVADYDGDVKDFEGLVERIDLPISSREAGDELIAELRTYAQSCAQ